MYGAIANGENGLLKVASRKSELALIQTNCVIDNMKELYKKKNFEIVTMSTKGDQILDKPLPQIGGKSLFTRELEDALEEKRVDFAVHSLKDLPTTLPPGLAIGAILQREDPRDALILHEKHSGSTLDSLPEGSIIGTSSLRRCSQLRRKYPRLVVKDIRGNLQTRLKKLEQGIFDGIILAVAGVQRMGWQSKISQILDEREMLYAVGQGALAVECRREDCRVFCHLSHIPTVLRVVAERSLLCRLEAGCSAPIAVTTVLRETLKRKLGGEGEEGSGNKRLKTGVEIVTENRKGDAEESHQDEELELTAAVWSLDGSQVIKEIMVATLPPLGHKERDQPEKLCDGGSGDMTSALFCGLSLEGLDRGRVEVAHRLGESLANKLLTLGAGEVIRQAKETNDKARAQ